MGDQVKQIVQALTPLAQKLGQGAEHVYAVYVKQSIVTGVSDVIFGIFWLAVGALVIKGATKLFKFAGQEDEEYYIPFFFLLLAVGILIVGQGFGLFTNAAGHFINPEYDALQNILCSVKGCSSN